MCFSGKWQLTYIIIYFTVVIYSKVNYDRCAVFSVMSNKPEILTQDDKICETSPARAIRNQHKGAFIGTDTLFTYLIHL